LISQYTEGSFTYIQGDKSFYDQLRPKFEHFGKGMLDTAISLIDSKGLTSIKNNLSDTTTKQIEMVRNPSFASSINTFSSSIGVIQTQTPFSKSKTEFGSRFMGFVG